MDSTQIRTSKFLSLILRHKAKEFKIIQREDGYVHVQDLVIFQ